MSAAEKNRYILTRQAELIYRNMWSGQTISLATASFLAFINQMELDGRVVGTWWLLACAIGLFRLYQYRCYRRATTSVIDPKPWLQRCRLGAGLTGLIWGGGALYFISHGSVGLQFFNAFIMTGMVAGAVPILAVDKLAFRYFATPIVCAVIVSSFGTTPLHLATSFMSLVFLVAITRSANNFNETLVEAYGLENDKAAQSRELLALFDISPAGIAVADENGTYLDVNPAYCSMFGYSREELLGQTFGLILPEDLRPQEGAILDMALTQDPQAPSLWNVKHRNGTHLVARSSFRTLHREHGTARIFTMLLDVTELQQSLERLEHSEKQLQALNDSLEDQVQERTAQLEQANTELAARTREISGLNRALEQRAGELEAASQAKSEFLANMSHEIRTPLNAVLGLAQVGRRDAAGSKNGENFGRILDAGQHLLGIINDILDFSKIEAGKLELENAPMAPARAIDQAVTLSAGRAWAKGLDLQVEESLDLPRECLGDALRLSQVLVNLLSNAIKFTEAGRVTLSAGVEGGQLVFRVMDSGIGMTAKQLERLFQPFEQADGSTTRRFGGTGLGLSISQHLVRQMGGAIAVTSEPGVGSVFEVRLPQAGWQPPGPGRGHGMVALAGFPADEYRTLGESLAAAQMEVQTLKSGEAPPAVARLVVVGIGVRDAELAPLLSSGRPLAFVAPPDERDVPRALRERAVRLEWPLRARHVILALDAPRSPAPVIAALNRRLEGIAILVAEDNEINRLVLEQMLTPEGARLTCVENGLLALSQVQEDGPDAFDLVLTDIQMPVMDGYATALRLSEMAPQLPVIGLTAHAFAEERDRCLAAGMVEHVAKPIQLEELVAVILRHLGLRPAAASRPQPVADAPRPVETLLDWESLVVQYPGKEAFALHLLKRFREAYSDAPVQLRDLAVRGDLEGLTALAHGIRGVAGFIMARELTALAAGVEAAAVGGAPETAALAEAMAAHVTRVLAEIERRLASPAMA